MNDNSERSTLIKAKGRGLRLNLPEQSPIFHIRLLAAYPLPIHINL